MSTLAFEYLALDKAGARCSGRLQAATQAEAVRKVGAMGLTPLRLKPARAAGAPLRARLGLARARRISLKDLAHFTYQLGVLMSSRIPLGDGLTSIAEQEAHGRLREVISDVARRIESGESIAAALEAHAEDFGDVYIQSIRAAEKTGNLVKVMEHLSDMLERSQEMRGHVRSALMYPLCVVTVLALAVTFLVAVVVPKFAGMFQSRNIPLPVFTRGLMTVGLSVQSYWYIYLAAAVATLFLGRAVLRTPRGRDTLERIIQRLPQIGQILRALALARFARVLGLGISSGIGVVEALELAGKASGRAALQADAQRLSSNVRRGGLLSEGLPACPYFTPFARRMLCAGEQSAELPRMCSVIARHYERESGMMSKNLTTIIEPVLIVAIAGVVLVVALAIFAPMWDMVRLVG